MAVVEDPETTAAIQKRFTRNIHHIINPQDMVVFMINEAIRIGRSLFTSGAELVREQWPELGIYFDVVCTLVCSTLIARSGFAHFGCIYLIEKNTLGLIRCLPVISKEQIPCPPPQEPKNLRFHRMEHYSYCTNQILHERNWLSDGIPGGTLGAQQFVRNCFSLPETVSECTGLIHDDRITVSATIASTLAVHLVVGVTLGKKDAPGVERWFVSLEPKPAPVFGHLEYEAASKPGHVGLNCLAKAVWQNLAFW